ncbi:hypothetical protein B0T14DRAFT_496685 [Immersiella caudata]|uniref:Uncharacterized protein n=1 Tax=Immersiella caudata TaxID=314043 RepID=A0AA40BZR5_9PEZI|nr:hypothetical protein B0T14DRAFT_496685 [Immersiella caudata]
MSSHRAAKSPRHGQPRRSWLAAFLQKVHPHRFLIDRREDDVDSSSDENYHFIASAYQQLRTALPKLSHSSEYLKIPAREAADDTDAEASDALQAQVPVFSCFSTNLPTGGIVPVSSCLFSHLVPHYLIRQRWAKAKMNVNTCQTGHSGPNTPNTNPPSNRNDTHPKNAIADDTTIEDKIQGPHKVKAAARSTIRKPSSKTSSSADRKRVKQHRRNPQTQSFRAVSPSTYARIAAEDAAGDADPESSDRSPSRNGVRRVRKRRNE